MVFVFETGEAAGGDVVFEGGGGGVGGRFSGVPFSHWLDWILPCFIFLAEKDGRQRFVRVYEAPWLGYVKELKCHLNKSVLTMKAER